jgi:hypothetical protein
MKTHSKILRTLQAIVLAIAFIGLTRSSLAADSFTNISIYASQPELTVQEGQSGYFEFTIANLTNWTIRIQNIQTRWQDEYPFGHPIYVSGEPEDEVYATGISQEPITPLYLGPGQTITFHQDFDTRDLHPDGDIDIGTWMIWNDVTYYYGGTYEEIHAYGSALVNVSDIPEPSSGAIFLLGIGLLCCRRWRTSSSCF